MLDIKFIRENSKKVKQAVADKGIDLSIDELLKIDAERKTLQQKINELREDRNKLAQAAQGGRPSDEQIAKGKNLKEEIAKLEAEDREVEAKFKNLMLLTPQIPARGTPVGPDESGNVETRKWGDIPKFDFKQKDHLSLGKDLDIIDTERGVKVSGFRGYFLKNEGALLQNALMQFAIAKMAKAGFNMITPPIIVKEFALFGTGYFPFGKGDNYEIANLNEEESGEIMKDKLYLAGTSEVGIGAYHANEILEESELPKLYFGFSPCYRREIGGYGKDTRGIYRVHEFIKVEQFVLCKNDYKESESWHKKMIKISESILKQLNIPHRVIQICTGDMGAGKYKMFDIESWMPSRNNYGETHSASNLGDWQARRLNIKYKKNNGEKEYVHTLNNTAIASPRVLISLLECNQNSDGSINIPKVLHKYLPSGLKKIEKK
ncbi:MAG: serine--tRNA ligase [bacterium]|nr:serine--tRNA ligase [bacterium]